MGKHNIYCLAESQIDGFECDRPFLAISINEVIGINQHKKLLNNAFRWDAKLNCFSYLILAFDDIEQDCLQYSGAISGTGIYKEQADTVADFVKSALSQGITVFVVQCQAGWSRSAGMASALALHLNGDKEAYAHGEVRPNQRVFRMVLTALMERVEVLSNV